MHNVGPEHPIDWDDAKIARLWDYYSRRSDIRDQYFAKIYGGYVLRRSGLPRRAPLQVLDFGCGPGFLFDHIRESRLPWRYSGLEFSEASATALQERAHRVPGFERAIHATGLPCELPSGRFDVAFLLEVVEHLGDTQLDPTIEEIGRLLRPGGLLVISTPNSENMAIDTRFCPECGAEFHQWQHVRTWTPETLDALMRRHRFAHQRTWVGHWDDHNVPGWLFNRAARFWLKKRVDLHMLAVYQAPAAIGDAAGRASVDTEAGVAAAVPVQPGVRMSYLK